MNIIAVFHGPPDNVVMAALPEEYNLSKTVLCKMLPRMIGIPVTYEHSGIHKAMEQISNKTLQHNYTSAVIDALNQQESPTMHVLGSVVDAFIMHNGAFAAQMHISTDNKPFLTALLNSGMLGNVSLTHVQLEKQALPLEISLVHSPARPRSKILHISADANESNLYKAQLIAGSTTLSTMPETPAPAPPQTCADALMLLPEAQRQIIAARLAELVKFADDSKLKAATLEEQLAASKKDTQMDQQILEGQLKQVLEYLPEGVRATFGMPNEIADCMKMFDPTDANKMGHATLRTLMCCNQAMMEMRMKSQQVQPIVTEGAAAAEPTSAKRVKVESETPMDVETVENAAPDGQSALARALYATFN